jgi:aspartate racemase
MFGRDAWDEVGEEVIEGIYNLQGAGADFAAIATNTPHNAYEHIIKSSPLEVLSIMDATAAAINHDKKRKVGLLGTKPTMELGFFQRTFASHGIETVIPDDSDREYIDAKIWGELVLGEFNDETREGYRGIIRKLVERGAEGIILGCTEIPLLIKQEDSPVQVYDTTDIHAKAILDYARE